MEFDYARALQNSNRNPRLSFGGTGVSTNEEGPEVSIERAFKIEKFTPKKRRNRQLREAMIVTTPVVETEEAQVIADVESMGLLVESGDDVAEILSVIKDAEGFLWARTRTSEGNVVDVAEPLWLAEFGPVIDDVLQDRTVIAMLRADFGLPAMV